jgi:hypothetical protein
MKYFVTTKISVTQFDDFDAAFKFALDNNGHVWKALEIVDFEKTK